MERLSLRGIEGYFKIRVIPQEWTEADIRYWWCDERDEQGRLIRPARMSQREKDRYNAPLIDQHGRECEEIHNLLTNTGISTFLTNSSVTSTGSMIPFAQILEVGSGSISGVQRTDTTITGALSPRKAPTGYTITGTQTDISFSFASGDAVASWTNIGLWGNGATTTAGTGSLETHALFTYNKLSVAVTVDYFIVIAN